MQCDFMKNQNKAYEEKIKREAATEALPQSVGNEDWKLTLLLMKPRGPVEEFIDNIETMTPTNRRYAIAFALGALGAERKVQCLSWACDKTVNTALENE